MCESDSSSNVEYCWREINESWSQCTETGLWLHKDTHYIYEHHAETSTFTALRPAQIVLTPEDLDADHSDFRFRIGTATMQGRRPKQEDRLLVLSQFLAAATPQVTLTAPGEVTVPSPFIMVADGHSGSETVEYVVSKLAAQIISNLTAERRIEPGTSLISAFVRGQRRLSATAVSTKPTEIIGAEESTPLVIAGMTMGGTQEVSQGGATSSTNDSATAEGAVGDIAAAGEPAGPPAAKRARLDGPRHTDSSVDDTQRRLSAMGESGASTTDSTEQSHVQEKSTDKVTTKKKTEDDLGETDAEKKESSPTTQEETPAPAGASASSPASSTTSWLVTEAQLDRVICRAFDEVDSGLIKMNRTLKDGSTATTAFLIRDQIIVAHCGDTRATWISRNADGSLGPAKVITEDHKPDLPRETKRITEAGGIVRKIGPCYRVLSPDQLATFAANPRGSASALAVARSFGDRHCKVPRPLLVATPDVNRIHLAPGVLVVATDGLWDVVSPEEVQRVVAQSGRPGGHESPRDIAGQLIKLAYQKNSTDNITCIVMIVTKTAWK